MDIIPIPGFSEPVSSLTHLAAAGVAAVAAVPLIRHAAPGAGGRVALVIFAFSAVFQLSMSGVYHLLDPGGGGRVVLQRLDHAAIFVLIAGTFTPIHVYLFTGIRRWGMLALIWTAAVTSLVLKSVFFDEIPEGLGLTFYLSLGWLGIGSVIMLIRQRGYRFSAGLLYGGVAYSIGAVMEYARWPVVVWGIVGAHELFHLAVIAALAWHWRFIHRLSRPEIL